MSVCKGCAHIVNEPGPKGALWARCFAPGPHCGYVMSDSAGRFFPYVPAWCPLMQGKEGENGAGK